MTDMNEERRTLLKASLVPLLLSVCPGLGCSGSQSSSRIAADYQTETVLYPDGTTEPVARSASRPRNSRGESGIRIIQPRDPSALLQRITRSGYADALANAAFRHVYDNYSKVNMVPIWRKPLSQIDLAPRLKLIARAAIRGAVDSASIWPVDPVWIVGQIMTESYFDEFAISPSLAVGCCQFIAGTGRQYGLVCAEPRTLAQVASSEIAAADQLREAISNHRKRYADPFGKPTAVLHAMLSDYVAGKPLSQAANYLQAYREMDSLQARYKEARNKAYARLKENFRNRSIFNPTDVAFLERFDQRALPSYCVPAMCKMMANLLRDRNGNILTATAGYNAGPGRTKFDFGVYLRYGRIPDIGETVTYVSRTVINHCEIERRM
ncbi:MAG: transglycosylase SLT domain-containing protein [Deltaproteobacteria bacterium]|nr:transglycosylase SLT domain-containing protein [Deltaproteobacteria bacterium]